MQAKLAVSSPPARWLAPHDGSLADGLDLTASSGGFGALKAAFRASGGIARADDLARLLCDRGDAGNGDPSLNELLTHAEVFGFAWHGSVWLPMFQFDLRRLAVLRAPQRVRAELFGPCTLDSWDCACWFARPHAALNHSTPVALLNIDLAGVVEAARADRRVLNG